MDVRSSFSSRSTRRRRLRSEGLEGPHKRSEATLGGAVTRAEGHEQIEDAGALRPSVRGRAGERISLRRMEREGTYTKSRRGRSDHRNGGRPRSGAGSSVMKSTRAVETHIEEEEGDIFPRISKVWTRLASRRPERTWTR